MPRVHKAEMLTMSSVELEALRVFTAERLVEKREQSVSESQTLPKYLEVLRLRGQLNDIEIVQESR